MMILSVPYIHTFIYILGLPPMCTVAVTVIDTIPSTVHEAGCMHALYLHPLPRGYIKLNCPTHTRRDCQGCTERDRGVSGREGE